MPISTVENTKIRLTLLCLSGFELYSRLVPLKRIYTCLHEWLVLGSSRTIIFITKLYQFII